MKIVKRIEDIQSDMWCKATEENFNTLKELGFNTYTYHRDWYSISNEPNFKDTDVLQLQNGNDYFSWCDYAYKRGEEFSFNLEYISILESLGFLIPETFKVEILKVYKSDETEYIGVVNNNIPAKWNSDGVCINPSHGYSLFREYKQRIYTKDNSSGFNPKQKFKVSWTEKMSTGLEQCGWKLATNEEIESFKY